MRCRRRRRRKRRSRIARSPLVPNTLVAPTLQACDWSTCTKASNAPCRVCHRESNIAYDAAVQKASIAGAGESRRTPALDSPAIDAVAVSGDVTSGTSADARAVVSGRTDAAAGFGAALAVAAGSDTDVEFRKRAKAAPELLFLSCLALRFAWYICRTLIAAGAAAAELAASLPAGAATAGAAFEVAARSAMPAG